MKWVAAFLSASLALTFASSARAADKIQTAAGVQQVEVTHSDEHGIWFKKGEAELQVGWAQVIGLEVAEPAEGKAARAAYDAAKADATKWPRAAAAYQPIVDKFPRLPTPWAEEATLRLIEAYAGAGKSADAETWLKKFQAWYPQSPRLIKAVSGLAQGLAAAKRYDEAIHLIESATEAKRKQLAVSEEDGKYLGEAMNLVGECYEKKGALDKALEAYLATRVLYYHDPAAEKVAKEKCEALKPRATAAR